MKKNYLSILAIFKNESHVLDEWINHYINEGVDHLYLINNNSSDNYKHIIDKYTNIISFFDKNENHKQTKHYNSLLPIIKNETEWPIVCDLDEFIFSKDNYKNIKMILQNFEKNILKF